MAKSLKTFWHEQVGGDDSSRLLASRLLLRLDASAGPTYDSLDPATTQTAAMMPRLLANLLLLTAMLGIAVVQLAPPMACCLVRQAVGRPVCCGVESAKPTQGSCCHRTGSQDLSQRNSAPTMPGSGDCPCCQSHPQIATADRAVVLAPVEAWFVVRPMLAVHANPVHRASTRISQQMAPRSALALCAMLCVWRI